MARILITSGPTREYLDPVRFLSNGSSGRMGAALAAQALRRGHEVLIVSGPVSIEYPSAAKVTWVVSTTEMLDVCLAAFPECDGVIAAAAPCDYAPSVIQPHKISKSSRPLTLELVETPDVVAGLGQHKRPGQWSVAFALESQNGVQRAMEKLRRKNSDLIVLNDPTSIESQSTSVQLIDRAGNTVAACGSKDDVASFLFDQLEQGLMAIANRRSY